MKTGYMLLISLLLIVLNTISRGEIHISNMERLLKDKLSSYNNNIRPLVDQSRPVDLNVSMELLTIAGIDEVEERLSIIAAVFLEWTDEKISWDPNKYGGIQYVTIKQNKIWTPNLMVANSADKLHSLGQDWNIVRVSHNGSVFHLPGDLFSVSCKIDITFYPWDEQVCVLFLPIWMYLEQDMKTVPSDQMVGTKFFEKSGSWELIISSVNAYTTAIQFRLVLRRKPTFVVVILIFTVLLMSLLNMLVFFIPSESGERISYSITVLLAIAVFLTIVGYNLPKTSTPMSILSYFLAAVLADSVLIEICSIQSVRLYHRGESEDIGTIWKMLVKCVKCMTCKVKPKLKDLTKPSHNQPEVNFSDQISMKHDAVPKRHAREIRHDSSLPPDVQGYPCIQTLHIDTHGPCSSDDGNRPDVSSIEYTWKDVSLCFDFLCKVVFFILLLVSLLVIMLYILTQQPR